MPDPTPNSVVRLDERDEEIEIRRLWHVILRNRWLVLGIAVVFVGAAALFSALQTPVYQSEATVLINQEEPGLDLLSKMVPAGLGAVAGLGGADNIQTDLGILRSRQVAEAVVDSLALQVALIDPNSSRAKVLQVLDAAPTDQGGVYRLELRDDGLYDFVVEEGGRLPGLPSRVEVGRPFRVGEFTLALAPALRTSLPEHIQFAIKPFRTTVGEVREDLRVTRESSGAQIVGIQFRHPDPLLAAAVPNVVTESFVRYKSRVNKAESNSTIDFLQDQLVTYEEDLRNAEATLQDFREQAQIVEPKTQATEQVRRLAEMQADRDAIQTERESLRRLLTRIEAEPVGQSETSPYRQLAAFPSFISNGSVQDILQSLIQLENERAELLVRRTRENVDVQGIDRRVRELELQLYQMARNYLEGLDNRVVSLDALLARFADQLELVPSREVEFLRLTREQRLLEEVYTLLQTNLKEAQIQAAAEPANVQVIDSALVPEDPVYPKPFLYLFLAGVVGLIVGGSGALVREFLDPKVHSREDVLDATSGLPVLGTIPRATHTGNGSRRGSAWRRVPARTVAGERLVTRDDPRNPLAEAYRTLRTNIVLADVGADVQVLVVTSAAAEDGKSTCASNLAVTLAQQGSRTLLVDTDLRKGTLHTVFGVPRDPGLAEVLTGGVPLESAVREIAVDVDGSSLHVLSTGDLPPNPAEVLGSARMHQLLERLRASYDAVILDAPPLNLVSDAAVLGKVADHVILVARVGATDKKALQDAVDQLHRLRISVAGVVLNGLGSPHEYYGSTQTSLAAHWNEN